MRWLSRETFKLYILFLLVITSFIQVGILWNYQNQGVPTNFLWSVFNAADQKTEFDMEDFFKPYRIVVSEGFQNPYWVVDEKQQFYSPLWNDAKYYINYLLTNKSVLSKEEYGQEYWGEVILKKSFIFEFKTKVSTNLIAAFLNVDSFTNFKPGSIYKMAILPSENINKDLTVYIYDGVRVNKYVIPFAPKGMDIDDYDNIINELYSSELQGYSFIKEFVPDKMRSIHNFRPDVLVVAHGSSYRSFNNIVCKVPDSIGNIRPNSSQDLDDMARGILGEEEDNYIRSIDIYGVIVFQNLSNMYRIYKDGLLEYKYLYVMNNYDKGSESEALKKAMEFIKKRQKLVLGVDIYLSGIIDNGHYYTFTFDYKFDNMPISFNEYYVSSKDKNTLNNAITIDVNSKRVLSCYWILKEFEIGNENLELNVKFGYLFDDTFAKYKDLSYSDLSIKDINTAYEVKYDVDSQNLRPVWIIETIDKLYVVPMREKPKKGE